MSKSASLCPEYKIRQVGEVGENYGAKRKVLPNYVYIQLYMYNVLHENTPNHTHTHTITSFLSNLVNIYKGTTS